MQTTNSEIKAAIDRAISGTEPKTKARNKALASVRWILFCAAGYAALTPYGKCFLTDCISAATVFDGRDNEELKARFWSAQLGTKLEIMLLP